MEEVFYITPEHYEIAKSNGIEPHLVRMRFERGWDIQRAITEPKNHFKNRAKELKDKLESINIKHSTYCQRKKNGWTPDEASSVPKKRDVTTPNPNSLRQLAIKHNMNYSTLCTRVNKLKWTLEEALTRPIDTKKRRLSDRKEENNG